MIGKHFEIIKDRQLYIFSKTFYMLHLPDNNNDDILILSTILVLNLVNNYNVVLQKLKTYEQFSTLSTLWFFLEIVLLCLHTNSSEHSLNTSSLFIWSWTLSLFKFPPTILFFKGLFFVLYMNLLYMPVYIHVDLSQNVIYHFSVLFSFWIFFHILYN